MKKTLRASTTTPFAASNKKITEYSYGLESPAVYLFPNSDFSDRVTTASMYSDTLSKNRNSIKKFQDE